MRWHSQAIDTHIRCVLFFNAVEANSYASQAAVNLYGLMSMQIPSVTLPKSPKIPEKNGSSGEEGLERLCSCKPGPSVAHVSSV